MKVLALPLLLLLAFAGCNEPQKSEPVDHDHDDEVTKAPTFYEALVRVSEETPDGAPIAAAEVYAVDERDMPIAADKLPLGQYTAEDGTLRLLYAEPTTVVLQVLGPKGSDWTREGLRVHVGENVTADEEFVVSEREVFVPLYRGSLLLSAQTTWGPASATVGPDGMVVPSFVAADLDLPEELKLAYLTRLATADVRLSWNETATSHAELAAGLAWNDEPWVEGEPVGPAVVPGEREATFNGNLPEEGRPADLLPARLQAVALTRSAVVGEIPLDFQVTLTFSGKVPAGMPAPLCLSMLCPSLPPV